jgi:hypothetical protein
MGFVVHRMGIVDRLNRDQALYMLRPNLASGNTLFDDD